MKTTAKFAFIAASLFAGSAMAFQDSMVDYPQNVAYGQQQPVFSRDQVDADLVANTKNVQADPIAYPSAYADEAPRTTQLTRQQVRDDLAHFVGNHFRVGVSPDYPQRG